jgi:uncharacterized protein (DUF1499 family)
MTIMSEVVLLLLLHWSPSTRWRLCQRLYYFYHTLITFNKMTIMSEVVLLLPYTDHLQQDEHYVRGCTTSTKYWPRSTSWKVNIMLEVVLLLPNTDRLQQDDDNVRGCSNSTIHWSPSTSWRLCQRLYYFYHTLIIFNKMTIMSEVVLLLPYTDHPQQDDDYVRGCTTSTIHWSPSTSWRLCQRLYYFYQILTSFHKLKAEHYVRGCSTVTKYWPPSTRWRLCQRLF